MSFLAIALGIGAAIAGVVGSVITARQSAKSTREANEANAALMREQMQYQTSERIASQEYNTPASQRSRFEAAGINPYMALGNINAGNTEAQSGISPPELQPSTDLSLANMVSGLGQAPEKVASYVQDVQQVQANKEAIEAARTENVFKAREKIMELNKSQADINLKLSQIGKNTAEYENLKQIYQSNEQMIKKQELELSYAEDYYSARNKKEREEADLAHEQMVGQWIENRIQSIHSQYAARIDAATLRKINAQAANEYAQMKEHNQLTSLYGEKTVTEFEMRVLNKASVKLDQEQKNVVNMYLGDMISVGLESQRLKNSQLRQDYSNPFKYVGGAVMGLAGAALGGAAGGAVGAAAGGVAGVGYSSPNTSYGTPAGGWSQLGY